MKAVLQLVLLCILLFCVKTTALRAQGVGIGTNAADTSALLDLTSNSKGLLIPRVDLASGNVKLPAMALMVFNTNAAYGTGTGIYINLGTAGIPKWDQLVPASSGGFVRNQAAQQPNSSFNVSGNGVVNGILSVGANPSPTEALTVSGNIKASGNIIMGLEYVNRSLRISSKAWQVYYVSCPSGKKAIGGGGGASYYNSDMKDINIHYSGPDPTNLNRWRIMIENKSSDPQFVSMYCICAKVQ